jgi:hypothetical protein
MVNKQGEEKVITTVERKHYETVAKMTGLELAKIEADELHPLHHYACEEIDTRNASSGRRHALDSFDEQDAWDASFEAWQQRDMASLLDRALGIEETPFEQMRRVDDEFTAASGFVDPEAYGEQPTSDMYA